MHISDSIRYVGVDDKDIDLFEGQFAVPAGMAYNSYVIVDDKIAVLDSVDDRFGDAWLTNVTAACAGRTPDYLVVHHMEMDHSSNIKRFVERFPEAKIVSSKMAFNMMKNMFGTDFADRQLVVSENATLALGAHTLTFIGAPQVHWPEVLMSYESTEKVLFSADAFGKFGANDYDAPEGWACEARRYYFGIVGKFGVQTQAVLKKAAALDIQTICSLHGPVLTGADVAEAMRLYGIWSSYGVESDGVTIAYTSVYGHTRQAAEKLAALLREKGVPKVALDDLARDDTYECIEDAFRYGKLVLASTTYDAGVFPIMQDFILRLTEHNYQNRTIGLIENGSWAPAAAKTMKALFEGSKNIVFTDTTVTVRSAMKPADEAALDALAAELMA